MVVFKKHLLTDTVSKLIIVTTDACSTFQQYTATCLKTILKKKVLRIRRVLLGEDITPKSDLD